MHQCSSILLLRNRIPVLALRMDDHPVVPTATGNAPVGHKRRERSREGMNPISKWRAPRSVGGEFATWPILRRTAQLANLMAHPDAIITRELWFLNRQRPSSRAASGCRGLTAKRNALLGGNSRNACNITHLQQQYTCPVE